MKYGHTLYMHLFHLCNKYQIYSKRTLAFHEEIKLTEMSIDTAILDKTVKKLFVDLQIPPLQWYTNNTTPPRFPHQCWSTAKKSLGNHPAFKATLSEGEGEGRFITFMCSPDGIFLKGDWNMCTKFAFFSISFIQDCGLHFAADNIVLLVTCKLSSMTPSNDS